MIQFPKKDTVDPLIYNWVWDNPYCKVVGLVEPACVAIQSEYRIEIRQFEKDYDPILDGAIIISMDIINPNKEQPVREKFTVQTFYDEAGYLEFLKPIPGITYIIDQDIIFEELPIYVGQILSVQLFDMY